MKTARNRLKFFLAAVITVAVALVLILPRFWQEQPQDAREDFTSLVLAGRSAFENADATAAIALFQKALAIDATTPDVHLNLANALLLGDQNQQAIVEAQEVLQREKNSAAALYIIGCANLRLGMAEEALKALQQSEFIETGIPAVHFQTGRALQAMEKWEDAAGAFSAAIKLEPEHPAAHYTLSQVLVRMNQTAAAQEEIERHQQITAKHPDLPLDSTFFEKCRHTVARLPLVEPAQPGGTGVTVTFADATTAAFGEFAGSARGPFGVIDLRRDGRPGIFVADKDRGFRVLENRNGTFLPGADLLPGLSAARYRRCLVADLNNDRFDDVIVLSDKGSKVFSLDTNGAFADITDASGLMEVSADDGLLADLDFTGKLGLITTGEKGVTFFRNQGNFVFRPIPPGSVIASAPAMVRQLIVDDWNGDDLPDLLIGRDGEAPQLWLNQHGGPLKAATGSDVRLHPATGGKNEDNAPPQPWPAGGVMATGDVNGDLRNDLVVATAAGIEIVFGGLSPRASISHGGYRVNTLTLLDYDNDGWLDIMAAGEGLRVWRNLGRTSFRETTADLGLDKTGTHPIVSMAAADFDTDGDADLLLDRGEQGLQFLRNDGGNANRQVKLHLTGRRSNASGIGARVELIAGGWRASRTVQSRPVEIGIGQHQRLDSLSVHWTDLIMNLGAVTVDPKNPLDILELEFPTGSCPYLYVWDGHRFRFITDVLGASPAGLRIAEDRFIEADTGELIDAGDESSVKPRDGHYTFQFTDELREVIYLDQVQFVVADQFPGTELCSTSKLRPGKPFPPHELVSLKNRRALLHATRSDSLDITAALKETDGNVASPVRLRAPQLRGLAEPFSVILDFGPLPADRPLALSLTGWLHFGGGMANVAASHDPALPFPFPVLEVELSAGQWKPVDVTCGAPAGKTKTILIDLTGKLPEGGLRLRLATAFEIHWDRIALFERDENPVTTHTFAPATAHLHWRGSAQYEAHPWTVPLTPDYDRMQPVAPWLSTLSGWCTRYGDVQELVAKQDDALVILNCGDEVTLTFHADLLPPKPDGTQRRFFLYSSGWDKDGDYHVERGQTVEPIPFQNMDDQLYGRAPRPVIDGDWWIPKYNTRWVGPFTLRKHTSVSPHKGTQN